MIADPRLLTDEEFAANVGICGNERSSAQVVMDTFNRLVADRAAAVAVERARWGRLGEAVDAVLRAPVNSGLPPALHFAMNALRAALEATR